MKVGVRLPSFIHEAYVEEAIQSILNLIFSDFELQISNNCSKDES